MISRRQALGAAFAAALVQSAATSRAQSLTLASGEVLRGRFTQQRSLQGFNAPLTSTGSFILAPGRGVLWRAETPFALITAMICRACTVLIVAEPPVNLSCVMLTRWASA